MSLLRKAPRRSPAGYTLVEAMVAISLTALAGAVVLLTVQTSLDAADQALEQTVAAGLAEQLLDEVLGAMYCEPMGDPRQTPLGPGAFELQGTGRTRFSEIGDYHGYSAQPPLDRWGQPIGQGDDAGGLRHANFRAPEDFDDWRHRVEVCYVSESDPSIALSGAQTSDYRSIEVVIERRLSSGDYLELARRRRVVTNLPKVP
jgi:type II secretory pathway pseudopilin PulG